MSYIIPLQHKLLEAYADYENAQEYFLEALLISLIGFDNKHQYHDFSTCIFTTTLNSFYALKEKWR